MDAPVLDIRGPAGDLRTHMIHHGASHLRITRDCTDLEFLAPCADLITSLLVDGAIGDWAGLPSLRLLRRLELLRSVETPIRLPAGLHTLVLRGRHALDTIASCDALRELVLLGTGLEDLSALPALDGLELLTLAAGATRSVAGVDRLKALRTLTLPADTRRDDAATHFLAEHFGVPDGIPAAPRPRANEAIVPLVRIDADRRRAEAAAASAGAVAYDAAITADQPGCVVVLIDRSASTEQRFGFDLRVVVDPDEPEHHVTTRFGEGPDGPISIAEGIAIAVNSFLRRLAERCRADAPASRDVHVAIIEYGVRVGPAWSGALAGRTLVPIAEAAAHPIGTSPGGATWIEPVWAGETPLGDALSLAHELVAGWVRSHPGSLPPLVINLTAAVPTGGDLARHAWAIRSTTTQHGPSLFFSIVRANAWGHPRFGVPGNSQTEREELYQLASPLPPSTIDAARRAGYTLVGSPRGYFQDASAADFENLLHVFTAFPGLPWSEASIHHPIPSGGPPAWSLQQDMPATPAAPTRASTPWKAPRVKGPMTETLFWKLVDVTRRGGARGTEVVERLTTVVATLDVGDIVEFDRILHAKLEESYRWDLWAVAFIAKGGCSDDGFEYFRCWLVAQGRTYFEAAVADPAHAAKRIAPGDDAELELLLSVARDAYALSTGEEDIDDHAAPREQAEPQGVPWKEVELPRLFPKLARKYGRQ